MKYAIVALSILTLSSAFGQRDLTAVRPLVDGVSPVLGLPHLPLVESDGSYPSWAFFELPMESALSVTPDGWVLGRSATNFVRWKPGKPVDVLASISAGHAPKATMNRLGDVVISYGLIEGGSSRTEIFYYPISGGSSEVTVPQFSYSTYFDCYILVNESSQSAVVYGFDDLGVLWVRQGDHLETFGCDWNMNTQTSLVDGFLGRSLKGGGEIDTPLVGNFRIDGVSPSGSYFGSYSRRVFENGGESEEEVFIWDGQETGTDSSGYQVYWVNSWGVALASDGIHYPNGVVDPLPSGNPEWIDENGDVRGTGFDVDLGRNVTVRWRAVRESNGDFLGYTVSHYLSPPLPEGWSSDHKMVRDETLPQIGIASNETSTVPFLLLPVYSDLDIDSDNDGVIARSAEEEEAEAPDISAPSANRPGKVLFVSNGDNDGDSVPDFADGLNLFGEDGVSTPQDSKTFVPILLELPDINDVRVLFHYAASDPSAITRITGSRGEYLYESASGQLRIWTKDGNEYRRVQSIGATSGDFVQSNVLYTREDLGFAKGEKTKTLYVESIRPSAEVAADRVNMAVWLNPPADNSVAPDFVEQVAFTSISVRMVTDYDRNGVIDAFDYGKLKQGDPFYFWVNDDNDDPNTETKGDDIPMRGDKADAMRGETLFNSRVDGTRDLVDFFPVYFDLKDFLRVFDPSEIAVRIFGVDVNYLEVQAANPFGWGFGPNTVGTYQNIPDRSLWFANASVTPVFKELDERSPYLSDAFVQQAWNGNGTLLVEGVNPSEVDGLKAQILYRGQVLCELSIPLRLASVEDMFRHVNLTNKGFGENETADRFMNTASGPIGFPDSVSNGKTFIFLHGYNVDNQGARGNQAEVFKRLFWSGSDARFVGVSWNGAMSRLPVVNFTPDYHENVINAFATAPFLVSTLRELMEGSRTTVIAAHSLGNMVVSSAIKDYGLNPDYYFMIDAAVAVEAYEEEYSNLVAHANMIREEWRDYDELFYSSNWHTLFAESDSDPRGKYTWINRFGIFGQAYNFYSSGEEVLESSDGTPVYLNELASPTGRWAWVHQETNKGRSLAMLTTGDQHGGWGFNLLEPWIQFGDMLGWNHQYLEDGIIYQNVPVRQQDIYQKFPPANLENLKSVLQYNPLFRKFSSSDSAERFQQYDGEALFAPIGDPSAIAQSAMPLTKAKVLGEAIPALSNPAGSNRLALLDGLPTPFTLLRNYNMNIEFQDKWPEERVDEKNGLPRWLHVDYSDVAYSYVYKVYDKFVEIGKLDEN